MAQKKLVVVETVEDLLRLINHNTETMSRQIKKLKIRSLLTLAAGGYMARKIYYQGEELYRLNLRVKELENKEGE